MHDAAMDINEIFRIFAGLFATVNPIAIVPLYLAFTENMRGHRTATARYTAIAVALILCITVLLGEVILSVFSISIDAFRIAGGILLMLMSLSMLQAKKGRVRHTAEEDEEAMDSRSIAVVPLAMPLLAGPGAMSTAILFSNNMPTTLSKFTILMPICISLAVIIWIVLHLAPQIDKRMSTTSMNVITRVMGLILAALAVEFITGGARNLLPGLAG